MIKTRMHALICLRQKITGSVRGSPNSTVGKFTIDPLVTIGTNDNNRTRTFFGSKWSMDGTVGDNGIILTNTSITCFDILIFMCIL